jgi:hypothetical protein
MVATTVLLGVLTGLHAATWGAYKDTPFEGFRWRRFARSIVLGALAAAVVALVAALVAARADTRLTAAVLVGLVYAGERLATEWWKAFLREQPQSSYAIPMRVAVGGRPIDARLPRYAIGAAVLVALVLSPVVLPPLAWQGPLLWVMVLVGGAGGWLTAVGGAWKDAPIEGFSPWKFMRSPAVATAWALVLVPYVDDGWVLAVSAGGLSVMVIETYKTFLTGGRPPGKFAGRPAPYAQHGVRGLCRALHCLVYGAIAGLALGSLGLVVPVAGAVAVAMLVAGHRSVVVASATVREPDTDGELRRARA